MERRVTLPIDEALKFIRTATGMQFAEAVDKAVELKREEVTIVAAPNEDGSFDIFVEKVHEPVDLRKAVATDEEQRYSFGPWYPPDSLDAHGEWSDRHELEQSFRKYMALPDADIRLQHNKDIVAGRRVEGAVWPFEVTVPMTKADGTVTQTTFPAGTPFMGTIWEPWAYQMVKEGKITGYSIGGTSHRLEVDMPGPDA
jgi:hypothetical protein